MTDTEERLSPIKQLIARGKEQGYLTYAEVNDHLPDEIVDPDQIEDIISMIKDMGIEVHEVAPDADALLLSDAAVTSADDDAEEAAAHFDGAPPALVRQQLELLASTGEAWVDPEGRYRRAEQPV